LLLSLLPLHLLLAFSFLEQVEGSGVRVLVFDGEGGKVVVRRSALLRLVVVG
jgi:hypothetical protein